MERMWSLLQNCTTTFWNNVGFKGFAETGKSLITFDKNLIKICLSEIETKTCKWFL